MVGILKTLNEYNHELISGFMISIYFLSYQHHFFVGGGHELSPESPICEVSCKNGTKFILRRYA